MFTLIIFFLLISVLIICHELGHFLTAKLTGIRVEEFGLGFPPRVWSKRVGETEYSLNLIPIGGFVRLSGEEGEEETVFDPRSFTAKPNGVRALVATCGVWMNLLLGIILFFFVFVFLGVPEIHSVVEIDKVAPGSPAEQAGIKEGDMVLSFATSASSLQIDEIRDSEKVVEFIKVNSGQKIRVEVKRGEEVFWEEVYAREDPPQGQGAMGIGFVLIPQVEYQQIVWWQAFPRAITETSKIVRLMVVGLKDMLFRLLARGEIPQDVAGPVGIAKLTGEVARQGIFPTIQFAGLLSINLAVINSLPFPALDGGRLLIVFVETLIGGRVHSKIKYWVHSVGIFLLLMLMALVTYYDIIRLF